MARKLTTILIIIVLILFNCQYSYAKEAEIDVDYYKDMSSGILAYKQVNAFQLRLSNGYVLADAALTTDSDLTIEENMKPVKIVFVLDTSGSMYGTKRDTTKSATQELVSTLFDKIGADKLEIGIIFFSNGIKGTPLELTNSKSTIDNYLEKIDAYGGTYMNPALEKAKEMLVKEKKDDEINIVCTLSDGWLADESDAINTFNSINNSGISTISIFAETSVTSAFQNLESVSNLHKNFQTSTAGLAETIATDIYNEIYMRIILMSEPKTIYNTNNVGILPNENGNGGIIIQADDEIIHGATIKIEYIISITTAFDATEIEIRDYSKNLTFSKNQKMLSENKTNSDYGWEMRSDGVLVHKVNRINAVEPYNIKIVLSQVLTPTNIDNAENYIEFTLKNEKTGKTINAQQYEDDGNIRNINSLPIVIIPPTGNDFLQISLNIIIILLEVLLLFVCIKHYIRRKKV